MQATTLTREELFAQVWAEPMLQLAPRYGLSDVGLAKICREMRIPLPWRGYWQKRAAGQKVGPPTLPPLPPESPAHLAQVTLVPTRPRLGELPRVVGAESDRGSLAPPAQRIVVPEKLVRPHPLVEQTRAALQRAKTDDRGMLFAWPKHHLDIRVTRASLDRALRIMDALVKALEGCGCTVSVRSGQQAGTVVKVGDDEVPIRLDERTRRVEQPRKPGDWMSKRYQFLPTGTLAFQVEQYARGNFQKTWADGKEELLEQRLNGVVESVLVAAEEEKARRLERERREREWKATARQREEARLREALERALVQDLEKRVGAWQTSAQVRAFAAAVEERVLLEGDGQEIERLRLWLTWVRSYADRLDPVLHREWLSVFERALVPTPEQVPPAPLHPSD